MVAAAAEKRKHRRRPVAGLFAHRGIVERRAVEPRWRTGLESRDVERHLTQPLGEAYRRRVTDAAARALFAADEDAPTEERADRQHDGGRPIARAVSRYDARDACAVDDQVVGRRLDDRQPGLAVEQCLDRRLVEFPVGLGARRTHGRALARVEDPELDAGPVDRLGHRAAERVDLLGQVALADAADRRIAAHLAERAALVGEQ